MPARASDPSRRINAERIVLLAWPRAILLQLAHPLIAAGVRQHSSVFIRRSLGEGGRGSTASAFSRLRHTVNAMLAITFGTDAEGERAIDGIRAIHRRVNGTLSTATGVFDAGTPYSAEDPALLIWVHATLVESMVHVYEEMVAPLTDAERDAYCADSADVTAALGARPRDIPRTWRATLDYMDGQFANGCIVVGSDARALAASLLSPMRGPIGRAIVTPLLSLVAIGSLPDALRAQYGFEWSVADQRRYRWLVSAITQMRRTLPHRTATWAMSRRSNKHVPMSALQSR